MPTRFAISDGLNSASPLSHHLWRRPTEILVGMERAAAMSLTTFLLLQAPKTVLK